MNLDFTPEETRFRDEVRTFFAANVPEALKRRVRTGTRLEPAEYTGWQKTLAAVGWGAPTWPREYGGTGWTPTQFYIFEAEAARADAPQQYHQGLELIGPIIFTFGTPEQKARYLPNIISGDHWWAQGYSEPGAGSDLAALKTRAVREGDHYIVNGQKTWTSYAHVATHMFCLVRTDSSGRKQSGISLLLIDMTSPGLKVRPILTLDERHHVNEVFLDDVRVPVSDLVGEEGRGWSYGKVLLDRERGVACSMGLRLGQYVRVVRDRARLTRVGRQSLLDTTGFREKLAQIEIEMMALEFMGLRTLADTVAGADSGPRASMLKIRWSELLQRITELWVESAGYDAADMDAPDEPPNPLPSYLHGRVTTIYGGSNEIQRNIIARRSLGL
jgi:alkylation response protein AidB-like acyl-CoA dehydrogenase